MADPQQVTAWDASGRPIPPKVTAWDAQGNPIGPPVNLDPKQAQDAADSMIYSHMTATSPSYAYEAHDQFHDELSQRTGSTSKVTEYLNDAVHGLKESVTGMWWNKEVPAPFESSDEVGKFIEGIGKIAGDLPSYLVGGGLGALAGGVAGTPELPIVGTISGAVVGAGAGGFALTEGLRTMLIDKYKGGKVDSFEEIMDVMKAAGKGALTGAATAVAGEAAPLAEGLVGKYLSEKAYKSAAEIATMTTVGSLLEGKVPTARDFIENAALLGALHIGMKGLDFAKDSVSKVQDRTMQTYAESGIHPATVVSEAAKRAVENPPTDNPIEVINQIDNEIARLKPQEAESAPAGEETPTAKPSVAPEPSGDGETGIKNAQTEAERAERGLPEVEVEARRSLGQTFDTAKEQVDSGKIDPRSLAKEMATAPRALSPEESGALIYDRMRLQNEHANVMNGIEDAREKGDTEREAREKQRLAGVEDAIDLNDQAARKTGYEQGLGLAARKMMLKQDYSLANTLQRARVAGDGTVSPELRNRLEDLTRQLDEANKRVDEYAEQKKQAEAQEHVDRIKRTEDFKQRSGKRAETKEALKAERDDLYKKLNAELMQNLSANPVFNPKLYELFGKLAANHIRDGIVTIEGIVDAIHENIQEHGMSKREIRDYISQYGRESNPRTQDEIQKQLAEAKKQGKLISAIEDAEAGEAPIKGKPVPKPSERVKELRKQLEQAMKDSGLIEEKEKGDPQETSLKAYKSRLARRVAELEKQLKTGDYTKPTKRTTILDQQAQDLKAQAEKLKGQVDQAIEKQRVANLPPLEKGMRMFQKWRRGILISSVSVGGKIGNMAAQRFGVTPIEELIGGVLSHVPGLDDIAAKAPREGGGLNVSAEAKAFAETFSSKTAEDMWEVLKTGKGSLDYLYGNKRSVPPELLDFVGHVHGALQTPTLRSEFARSLEKRTQWAIDNHLDIEDPKVQATLAGDAYVDANRAVFRQENFVNSAFRMVVKYLQSQGLSGKATAFMMETVLPIVKLPTNIVSEAMDYSTGAVTGSIKALQVVLSKDGLKNLTMHEADNILRSLKKGSVGLAMLAIGYYAGQSGGAFEASGFYQRGDEKKKLPGLRIGDVELPSWVLDTPVGLTFQIGATMRRVHDAYAKDGKPGGYVAGATAGAIGVAKKFPFTEQAIRAGRALESPSSAGLFIDDLIQSLVIPPDLRKVAAASDDDKKRKPTDLKETLEMGVPGLRENVPDKQKGKKRSIRGMK